MIRCLRYALGMNEVAYLSVFARPDGTWTRAGVYSEFPCEQMEQGAWAMLAAFKARSFHVAARVARKHAKQHFPWLKLPSTRVPRVLVT